MIQLRFEHMWLRYGDGFNDYDKPGRWMLLPDTSEGIELWNFLTIDLEYYRPMVADCLEGIEEFERGDVVQGYVENGYAPPGEVASGNDGAMYFGNGHILIASDYADHRQVVMTADEMKKVLRHVLATMDHPDYRNPNIDDPFEPLIVTIIADGPDAHREYFKRGGITPVIPEEFR